MSAREHIEVEALGGVLPPGAREHAGGCEDCAALLAAHDALGASQVRGDDPGLRSVHDAARAELARAPVAPRWTRSALVLGFVLLLLSGAVLVFLPPRVTEARPFGLRLVVPALLVLVAQAGAAWAALAPGGWRRGLPGLALTAVALAAIMLGSTEGTTLPWTVRGAHCFGSGMLFSLPPLLVALWLLRNAAPSRWRALLAGLGAGAVGTVALHWNCPQRVLHVAVYHVGAWVLVAFLAILLAGRLKPRTYAP